eukprot:2293129-Amphidinium_carterae.1
MPEAFGLHANANLSAAIKAAALACDGNHGYPEHRQLHAAERRWDCVVLVWYTRTVLRHMRGSAFHHCILLPSTLEQVVARVERSQRTS